MATKNESDHGHGHGVTANADQRYLAGALTLIVGFMAVEVIIGIAAGSLALISDAGHMLTDAVAIGLALVAIRLAARPAQGVFTYGLKRAEILSAQANGITLALLVVYFVYEAISRLIAPPAVDGALVTITAGVGIVINVGATWLLSRANRSSLNVESVFQHILNDLFAFIATGIAGLLIWLADFRQADAIAALIVAALMAKASYGLLRESGRVFLEAAPRGTNPAELDQAIRELDGVVDVHELHVWEVTSGFPALSAHVLVSPAKDCHERRAAIENVLDERFNIRHTTLQVDHKQDLVATQQLRRRLEPELGERACDGTEHPGH
ncbi:MAG: cation diffusion facilitator family transporter [Nocardioidaceae bacterium]